MNPTPTRSRRRARTAAALTLGEAVSLFIANEEGVRRHTDYVKNVLLGGPRSGPGLVTFLGPDVPIDKITPTDLNRWRGHLAQRHSPSSRVNRCMAARACFRWLHEAGLLETNPAATLRVKKLPLGEIRYLTSAQREELLQFFARHLPVRWALFGIVVGQTGARPGELEYARWRDIEAEGIARIFGHKTRKYRSVPLPAETLALIEPFRGDPEALIFPHLTRSVRQYMKTEALRESDAPSFAWDWKVLRASYATHLISRGVRIEVVSKLLGHTTTRVTLAHYAHLAPSLDFDLVRGLLSGNGNGNGNGGNGAHPAV